MSDADHIHRLARAYQRQWLPVQVSLESATPTALNTFRIVHAVVYGQHPGKQNRKNIAEHLARGVKDAARAIRRTK